MMDATQYKAQVNWQTLIKAVISLTAETTLLPATYRLTVKPLNLIEPGAQNSIIVGYYIEDYFKNRFRIDAVNGYVLDVSDSFRCGCSPQIGLSAQVYKSVDSGAAPFLTPTIDNDILYKTREEIAFTATNIPQIPTLADVAAGETYASKYATRYGQIPNLLVWIADGTTWLPRPELQPVITTSGGLITLIQYSLDDNYTGKIIISR